MKETGFTVRQWSKNLSVDATTDKYLEKNQNTIGKNNTVLVYCSEHTQ